MKAVILVFAAALVSGSPLSGQELPPAGDRPRAVQELHPDRLAILREVQNIEQLEGALEKARRTGGRSQTNAELEPFGRLVAALASLRAGFAGETFETAVAADGTPAPKLPPEWSAQLNRLRGLLLLTVLPRYIEVREQPPVKEGENGSEYLLRLLEDLVRQRRFAEASRVLEAYRLVAFGSANAPSWIEADASGLRIFAAADRFLATGNWLEAICTFRKAVEVSGKFTPSLEAAQRVADLSRSHPAEARAASRLAETEALYHRLTAEIAYDAARAPEPLLPADIRLRIKHPPAHPRE